MEFQPKPYTVLTEEEFSQRMPQIEQALNDYAHTGSFYTFDGKQIAYQYFLCRNAKANVVVIHGFTEFYCKYYELTWYLLHEGYNVFLYDQRGHGLSERDVKDPQLVHINHFEDYARDLDCYIHSVVLTAAPDLPLNLYAHSMGGTVAALYLAQHSDDVNKAFLSAPMICPYAGGIPRILIWLGANRYLRKLGAMAHFPYSGHFDPNADFHASSDASRARFTYYLNMRIRHRSYQTSGATNQWMVEVAKLQKKLLNKKFAKQITADVCLVSCQNDRVVRTPQQHRFAALLPHGSLVVVSNAAHSLYTSTGEQLQKFYDCLFDFFR